MNNAILTAVVGLHEDHQAFCRGREVYYCVQVLQTGRKFHFKVSNESDPGFPGVGPSLCASETKSSVGSTRETPGWKKHDNNGASQLPYG